MFTKYRSDVGLLILRLVFGGFMAFGHGLPKLQNFAALSENFPDPIGLGAPVALALAVAAEIGCGLLVALGVFTRWATIPLMITMIVAAFVVHADGPLFLPGQGAKEPALLFLAAYLTLAFTGGGKFSLYRG